MKHDRRQFLSLAAGALGCGIAARNTRSQDKDRTRLILLGTRGGPRLAAAGRNNPSTLLLINGVPYVVDCGYGTSRQLLAAGTPHNKLRYIFITHHHSDHNIEYGTLFYNAWVTGLSQPVEAYGPPGIGKMTRDFFGYMELDIAVRIADEGRPDPRPLINVHELRDGEAVLRNSDVTVTALRVPHPMVKDAYAYRFDARDRSIVISGDTAYAPALAEFAKDADVLVHEVMYLPGIDALVGRLPNATRLRRHLLDSHTLPEDVGRIAAKAGVKTLVLSHLVPGDSDSGITDADWSLGVRKHFNGKLIVGKDLMEV